MNTINDQGLMKRMEMMAAAAQGRHLDSFEAQGNLFSKHFNEALNRVNDYQKAASSLKNQYELDPNSTNLVDVTIASQKARLAFQSMLQVNKRLLSAYKDIMGMPL